MKIGTEIVDAVESALASDEALGLCCDTIEEREALTSIVVDRLSQLPEEDSEFTELELPYPPSLNHYYRRVGPRTLISKKGREYRERISGYLAVQGIDPFLGPLQVQIELYPPDRRLRDVDNTLKALLDALEKGGAYHNDVQIERLEVEKRRPVEGGRVIARISSWDNGRKDG